LIPRVPNDIQAIYNGSSNSQLTKRRPTLVANGENIMNVGKSAIEVEQIRQPGPDLRSKITVQKKMRRGFIVNTTQTTHGGQIATS
jgi:hypothetical protein